MKIGVGALDLLARWLPRIAPLIVHTKVDHIHRAKSCEGQAAANRDSIAASKSNMAVCARVFLAAGRRGAQRLAVAFVESEAPLRGTGAGVHDEAKPQYTALVRALLLFAATTARKFTLTRALADGDAVHKDVTSVAAELTRTFVTADTNAEDAAATGTANGSRHAIAPLTRASLHVSDCSAASLLASMVKASCSAGAGDDGPSEASPLGAPDHPSYDAMPGAVTMALRPRVLAIDARKLGTSDPTVSVDDVMPWIRRQDQLRVLSVWTWIEGELDAIIEAVHGAGCPLEELLVHEGEFGSRLLFTSPPISLDAPGSPLTPRFPALRVLHVPSLNSMDLQRLPHAAPALVELAAGDEARDVTGADWAHVLSHMKHLRVLRIESNLPMDEPIRRILPSFYGALFTPSWTPACDLRELSCSLEPSYLIAMILDAVARHLPRLESISLPAEIFNVLALACPNTVVRSRDEVISETVLRFAKTEVRRAVMAATKRCTDVTLRSSSSARQEGALCIAALAELHRLLPKLQCFRRIAVCGDEYAACLRSSILSFRSASQISDMGDSEGTSEGSTDVPPPRKLHLTGPLSQADLAKVARACPHLRELRCEYGGPRPRIEMDYNNTPHPQLVRLVAAAVFIEWLGAILDVSAAECSHCSNPKVLNEPTMALPNLRRLYVAKPPFDGENDAASMDALARVRAHHPRLLIAFE